LGLCKDPFKVLDIPVKKRTKVYLKRRMSLELYQGEQRYYKIIRNVITKGRRTELCQRSYWFGRGQERIKIKSILYQKMYVAPLIIESIFGSNFCNLTDREKVKETDRTILIHIYSATHLQELLSIDGLCFSVVQDRYKKYQLCGKINFRCNKSYTEQSGYILTETDDTIKVLTISGEEVSLLKPNFNQKEFWQFSRKNELTQYEYKTADHPHHTILEYQPVRIVISKNGVDNMKILSHRLVLSSEGELMIGMINSSSTCKFLFYI